uniref:E3 ubiquitin-protein ligase bre1 n=1 Tax=Triatoma infestans TaxID=30076 RepID=A0A161MNF4_TRIIF
MLSPLLYLMFLRERWRNCRRRLRR